MTDSSNTDSLKFVNFWMQKSQEIKQWAEGFDILESYLKFQTLTWRASRTDIIIY